MKHRLSFRLGLLLVLVWVPVAIAAAQTGSAAPDPLVQVLVQKGILNADEARSIYGTAEEQHNRLAELLKDKGIISRAEYDQVRGSTATVPTSAALAEVRSTVFNLNTNANPTAISLQEGEEQKEIRNLEHPTAIHFKGITITPGGFLEAAGIVRTRDENASVNSASGDFNIPFSGTTNGQLTEFRFDARQSRLSLLAEGHIGATKATGYYEVDFLGAAPTANENQSNSFNLRQRQLWASASTYGLTFTGGQQWSLFTLNRKGIANGKEFLPMTINAQYVIGYDWARQPGFRAVKAGCVQEQINATAPPSCPNNTRYALEVTPGFWYRFYQGSAGIFQWGAQYSYSTRKLWQDSKGFSPKGVENQVYTSFRYYLP